MPGGPYIGTYEHQTVSKLLREFSGFGRKHCVYASNLIADFPACLEEQSDICLIIYLHFF